MLATTLDAIRKRIAKRPKLNENDTKATLIEPVLNALGREQAGATRGRGPMQFQIARRDHCHAARRCVSGGRRISPHAALVTSR